MWLTILLLLVVLVIWWQYRFSHRKRINLQAYAIYLLLSDQIRDDHQLKFFDYLVNLDTDYPLKAAYLATGAVERMSSELAEKGSLISAAAMIQQVRRQWVEELTKEDADRSVQKAIERHHRRHPDQP
ncbi:MAG: hypothetical protein JSW71_11615 [Gemmatimonadota bacterium]|nr:MAG: hypothetical protein JSW71_11615 [Gemmatimonadota bacterium]